MAHAQTTTSTAEPAAQSSSNQPLEAQAPTANDSASSAFEPDDAGPVVRDAPVGKPPESTRWLLIGVGAGTTALWYAGAYGIRELWPDAPGQMHLRYPIAGPFMDLYDTGCPASDSDCSTFQLVVRTVLVSLDAIGQVGGVALMLQGAVLGTASAEVPRSGGQANLRRSEPAKWLPVPWTDGKSGGLGIVGRF